MKTVGLALVYLSHRVNSIASVLAGVVSLMGLPNVRRSLDMADVGIHVPGIDRRSLIDPKQFDLIGLAEEVTGRRLDELDRRMRGPVGILGRLGLAGLRTARDDRE